MMRASIVVAVVVVLALPAAAQSRREKREERREELREKRDDKRDERSPGVNKKQRRQGSRIVGGVKSGQLTQQEVDELTARERALRELEGKAKADGTLTVDERKQLHGELQSLSKQIRSEKHDLDKTGQLQLRADVGDRAAAQKARRLGEVRRALNQGSVTGAERAALESEHATLVDGLFEEATPVEAAPPVGRGW
jgi:hypothetical protein